MDKVENFRISTEKAMMQTFLKGEGEFEEIETVEILESSKIKKSEGEKIELGMDDEDNAETDNYDYGKEEGADLSFNVDEENNDEDEDNAESREIIDNKNDGMETDSDEYKKKAEPIGKFDLKDLDNMGSKEELAKRIMEENKEMSSEDEEERKCRYSDQATERSGRNASANSGQSKQTTMDKGARDVTAYVDYSSSEESVEKLPVAKRRKRKDYCNSGLDYNPSGSINSDVCYKQILRRGRRYHGVVTEGSYLIPKKKKRRKSPQMTKVSFSWT